MEASRYLQCLAADYGDLRDAASAAELTANVASCPGWTVADLVRHVAQVYLHKVALMRTGEEPEEWPPPSLAAEAPLAALGRAYGALRAEFRTRGPGQPAPTWYDPDQTVAFWIRRMALETGRLVAVMPALDDILPTRLAYSGSCCATSPSWSSTASSRSSSARSARCSASTGPMTGCRPMSCPSWPANRRQCARTTTSPSTPPAGWSDWMRRT